MLSEFRNNLEKLKLAINEFKKDTENDSILLKNIDECVGEVDGELGYLEHFFEDYEEFQNTFISMNTENAPLKVLTLEYFNGLYSEDLNIWNLCIRLMYSEISMSL